jgi:hypothetical protein
MSTPLRRLVPLGVGLALLCATAGATAAQPSTRAASAGSAAHQRAHWIRDGLSASKPGKRAHWIRDGLSESKPGKKAHWIRNSAPITGTKR